MLECDAKLEAYLALLPTRVIQIADQPNLQPAAIEAEAKKPKTRKKPRGNAPALDLTGELKRISGVDLTSIDGIDVMTAQTILSELGTDLSAAFPTENRFASWLGLAPSKDISGGKVIGRSRRKVHNRVAMSLRMSASTLLNSKSYLGARYRHLRRHLPTHAAAVKAMAHYLALLVYRLLTKGQAWVDRGAAKFEQRRAQWELSSLKSKALEQGFKLVPISEVQ
jgi:transposase